MATQPLYLSHPVKYTVSYDGVPLYKREELSRRLGELRQQLRESRPRGSRVDVTLACPATGPGYLLAVIDGQQYSCEPPDAWWCVLLGWSSRCPDGRHAPCEESVYGQVCTRCGAIRERITGLGIASAMGPWLHVGTDEHHSAMRRIADSVLASETTPWPLALFANETELSMAVAS